MAFEPVEFFVDVELLGNQCKFGFQSCGISLYIQLVDSSLLPCANGIENFGDALAYGCCN